MLVELRPVDETNWQDVVALAVDATQADYVPPPVYSLAEAYALDSYEPLAIVAGDEVVGFAMTRTRRPGETPWFGASHWLSRFLVDRRYQRRGYGRAALAQLLARLAEDPRCEAVSVSYHPSNDAARRLYAQAGFEAGETAPWGEEAATWHAPRRTHSWETG